MYPWYIKDFSLDYSLGDQIVYQDNQPPNVDGNPVIGGVLAKEKIEIDTNEKSLIPLFAPSKYFSGQFGSNHYIFTENKATQLVKIVYTAE